MSKFIEDIKKLYEEKKDSKKPPRYIKTIKQLLELEGFILDSEK